MTGRWLLLPAALAAWAGALLGTIRSAGTFGSAGSAWLPGLIVAATGVVVAAVGIRRWLGRPDARAVGLSSAGAGLVLVGVSASLHVAAVHAAPWWNWWNAGRWSRCGHKSSPTPDPSRRRPAGMVPPGINMRRSGSGVGRRRPQSCAGSAANGSAARGLRNALATAEPSRGCERRWGRRVHLDARRHRAGPRAGGATPTWRDRWRGVCSAHRY